MDVTRIVTVADPRPRAQIRRFIPRLAEENPSRGHRRVHRGLVCLGYRVRLGQTTVY